MDFFRNIFGFSRPQTNDSNRFFGFNEENNSNESSRRNFNVFTDPLEMHRYFEQQMDQVFRTFGFPNLEHFFNQVPSIESNLNEEDLQGEPKNLREKFLKEEYVKPHYEKAGEKIDKDLDGKLNLGDLDLIVKDSSDKHSLDVYRKPKPFGNKFFNQSVQVKTMIKPDGSVETHRTVRDSQGNEETTITQKLGDKEYTIVKKVDKNGKEETEEIMINMNDSDKSIFQRRDPREWNGTSRTYLDNSIFNNFFK